MPSTDPPGRPTGRSDPASDRDVRRGRHRARHADAAPDAYPDDGRGSAYPDDDHGYAYGDGYSAEPLYARPPAPPPGYVRPAPGSAGAPPPPGFARPAPPPPPPPVGPGTAAGPGYGRPAAPPRGAPPATPSGPAHRPGPPAAPPGPAHRPGPPAAPPGPGHRPGQPATPPGPAHRPGPATNRPAGRELARIDDVPPLPPLELDLSDEGRTGRSREERRAVAAEAKKGRAGRNLPAAIGVGVLLAAIVLGSLFLWRPAFVGVLAVGAGVGVWEMVRVLSRPAPDGTPPRAHPPLVPLLGGCVVMQFLAWYGGISSLVLGLLVTVLAAIIWRLSTEPTGFHRDIAAATMIAVYVPFLLGFGVLLAMPDDGQMRVLTVLALVILSDTGGYAAGVFFGKHPMAPSVSPKKSWEGLVGSLVASGTGGALLVQFVFHDPWWHGVILGLATSAAAVVGDLAESLLKRDLKIKDMSDLLPGHGGLMDRLDSVVFAAPTAFMVMSLLVPA